MRSASEFVGIGYKLSKDELPAQLDIDSPVSADGFEIRDFDDGCTGRPQQYIIFHTFYSDSDCVLGFVPTELTLEAIQQALEAVPPTHRARARLLCIHTSH